MKENLTKKHVQAAANWKIQIFGNSRIRVIAKELIYYPGT